MEEFDFHFHQWSAQYPDNGERMQLGGSYTFTASSPFPDQRVITLHFKTMRYYRDPVTNLVSDTINPAINFKRLEGFYNRHKLSKRFNYSHAAYGMLVCTFNKPLQTPKGVEGSPGELEGFTLELLEHP